MESVRYVVVGAGVSGLAFADWLGSDDLLVLEADAEVGGYCKTVKRDGFVWDYSGHFFHFRDKDIERYLIERMGDQQVRVVKRESRIHYKGHLVDFPFQKNIHQLPHEDFLDCLVDLFDRPEGPGDNFEAMLRAKFGRSIAEKFLIPYNEKLYATDLRALDVDAMGRFFPYAEPEEIVRNFRTRSLEGYNAHFTYPEGGAIQYVEALRRGVPAAQLCLQERVLSIDLEARVATTNQRQMRFDTLISSMPFDRLLSACRRPFDDAVYSYNKVLVFNLGFDRKGPRDLHWVYYPQRDLSFYRIGFYDNIFDTERMSLYVELGFPQDAALPAARIESLRAQVLDDLKRVKVIADHQLVAHHHVVLDPAYVHITKRSMAEVQREKQILATAGVYSLGRYGAWTYCSIEDNIVEARALAELFQQRSSPGAI